ncbi:zinc ribbon domain-containing protein [Paludisphaera mucosa]|uniref:Zinc ribbon domain-containing protein n=1 Tax=Paludisphaera mucosa TaxID=3030827 RepID=A0ABT6FI25_9BACT|nr:zinc ribbon domain-containing protein [Paludisphaera mucosa]MDG3007227.1 zinc ribbon domain-containing protein [Paludisphaera mucosa]
MPRWDDDDDEEEDWDDGPDDDEDENAPCPYCGREIHEDSPRCPSCGSYISREDAPSARKPWWIILGAIACLYAVYRGLFLGF